MSHMSNFNFMKWGIFKWNKKFKNTGSIDLPLIINLNNLNDDKNWKDNIT